MQIVLGVLALSLFALVLKQNDFVNIKARGQISQVLTSFDAYNFC